MNKKSVLRFNTDEKEMTIGEIVCGICIFVAILFMCFIWYYHCDPVGFYLRYACNAPYSLSQLVHLFGYRNLFSACSLVSLFTGAAILFISHLKIVEIDDTADTTPDVNKQAVTKE